MAHVKKHLKDLPVIRTRLLTGNQKACVAIWARHEKSGSHRRQDLAVEMWRAGLTYKMIAKELGYSSYIAVCSAVHSNIRRHNSMMEDLVREIKESQLAKLHMMEEKLFTKLSEQEQPDVKVVDALLRLYKRESDLVGADSAQQVRVVNTMETYTDDELLSFIEKHQRTLKDG